MRKVKNALTGKEEMQFNGKLLSISNNVLTNSNGKSYKVVSIEFVDIEGVVQKASGIIYEGNYKNGVEVGKEYLCTASESNGQAYIHMSHLTGAADRPTLDMFGFSVTRVETPGVSAAVESALA
jgi:hypothetical protein